MEELKHVCLIVRAGDQWSMLGDGRFSLQIIDTVFLIMLDNNLWLVLRVGCILIRLTTWVCSAKCLKL